MKSNIENAIGLVSSIVTIIGFVFSTITFFNRPLYISSETPEVAVSDSINCPYWTLRWGLMAGVILFLISVICLSYSHKLLVSWAEKINDHALQYSIVGFMFIFFGHLMTYALFYFVIGNTTPSSFYNILFSGVVISFSTSTFFLISEEQILRFRMRFDKVDIGRSILILLINIFAYSSVILISPLFRINPHGWFWYC